MEIQNSQLASILSQYNPWWRGEPVPDLPSWKRASFAELYAWIAAPPLPRALLLSGARQVGKTTLIKQAIDKLLKSGVAPGNILYATFDHPLLKLAGIEAVIAAWRERETKSEGLEYVFLDETQFVRDWGTWVKHQVDFSKSRRVVFTGSAMPLLEEDQESGVGRWHTIKLTTLSFYEFLRLKQVSLPQLPSIRSLREIAKWDSATLAKTSEIAQPYAAHFHNFLVLGGFPQIAMTDSITLAQRSLREDIVDKAIKRDMTAQFGVRNILDLENTFLYICLHDGGIMDMSGLSKSLQVSRQTAQNYIRLLEATHLIYRLQPFGYGKEVLKGRSKIYLADASIAPAVMLKGRSILDDPRALGVAAEAAVLKHLFARYYKQNVRFTYWRNKNGTEVDLIAEIEGLVIPFEVKYQSQPIAIKEIKGLLGFCEDKKPSRGYIITKSLDDFGPVAPNPLLGTTLTRVPGALFCYWMGEMELQGIDDDGA